MDLHEAAEKNQAAIHAYVLMTNHVHLLVTPAHPHSISHMMQDLGRKYVRYINHTYKRTGSLWEGRYKASLVDSETYLLTCMRYIEMNPVRAGMVNHPGEYKWSSYSVNASGKVDSFLSPHPLYLSLAETVERRQFFYRELFQGYIESAVIHEIRDALNQELVLGGENFKIRIEEMTKRQTRPKPMGRPCVEEELQTYYVI